ncbi:hypothetical protein CCR94_22905 [Rhodoblastus sphagnicola]|uniref:Homogentisate 1,2-dioxygenase n=1 Tax=Rhodoblastus sphagnicola TaxID=333368 RepID=A0A2S6MVS9_9HYPH|nr:hypothetical protein [Rhodoblastus sphagnicola]MBB4198299.1 hypothetical protein [Rhodoblastus sphagnicola]PPQ26473.1 hypothetical protein CCR94_22905 [Rhodoblastus sphagnicola]
MLRSLPALALCAFLVTPACAQESPAPKCPEDAAPLPAELSAWTAPKPLTAATRPEDAGKAEIAVGAAVKAQLVHTPEVTYAARPTKPGGGVAYGGLLHVAIAEAGTYRVALGNASWVDVVKGGEKIESVGHGGGPACSGIRKIVNYSLQKGDYFVQLSAGAEAQTGVLVVKLP